MGKEFIGYTEALELKELGFDEPCFGYYHYKEYYQNGLDFTNIIFKHKCKLINKSFNLYPNDETKRDVYILEKDKSNYFCKAPTYSQAFKWFRKKYGLYGYPFSQMSQTNFWFKYFIQQEWKDQITSDGFITHEEAELECLKKLIEIVKEQK